MLLPTFFPNSVILREKILEVLGQYVKRLTKILDTKKKINLKKLMRIRLHKMTSQ